MIGLDAVDPASMERYEQRSTQPLGQPLAKNPTFTGVSMDEIERRGVANACCQIRH